MASQSGLSSIATPSATAAQTEKRRLVANFPAEVVYLRAGNSDFHKLADRGAAREQYARVNFRRISFGPSDQGLLNERLNLFANHRLG